MIQLLPHLKTEIQLTPVPGKVIVLTGENGIGKSTLLHHFFEHSGGIFCEQKPLDLFFDRSLKDFRSLLISSSQVIDKNLFDAFWNSSGLSGKENRKLSHLSGGEAQLLKLISVCSSEGEVYLLDEPGQYLDRDKKLLLGSLIENLLTKKKALVIVEHDCSWLPAGAAISKLHVEDDLLKVKSTWTI